MTDEELDHAIMRADYEYDSLKDKVHDQFEEIKELNNSITWWTNRFNAVQRDYENLQERIDKAIDYINKHMRIDDEYPDYMEMLIEERNELLEILRDKGIEEIPLFDGTLEQLNNLSIIGDKENE